MVITLTSGTVIVSTSTVANATTKVSCFNCTEQCPDCRGSVLEDKIIRITRAEEKLEMYMPRKDWEKRLAKYSKKKLRKK